LFTIEKWDRRPNNSKAEIDIEKKQEIAQKIKKYFGIWKKIIIED